MQLRSFPKRPSVQKCNASLSTVWFQKCGPSNSRVLFTWSLDSRCLHVIAHVWQRETCQQWSNEQSNVKVVLEIALFNWGLRQLGCLSTMIYRRFLWGPWAKLEEKNFRTECNKLANKSEEINKMSVFCLAPFNGQVSNCLVCEDSRLVPPVGLELDELVVRAYSF